MSDQCQDEVVINIVEPPPLSINIGISGDAEYFDINTIAALTQWGTIYGILSAQTDLWAELTARPFRVELSALQTFIELNSASWEESAEIVPTVTQYLSANSIVLSSINVLGQILSAGQDLAYLFDNQTLSYVPSSYELSISNGNTVSLSSLADVRLDTLVDYLSNNNVLLSGATITRDLSVGGAIYSALTAIVFDQFSTVVGDGVNNTFSVIHNLGTMDVSVVVRDLQTNLLAYPSIKVVNRNVVDLSFNFVPLVSSYNVSIFGGVPSNRIAAFGIEPPERPLNNVLYVSMSGDDTNTGREPYRPVRTIKKACEIAHNARVNSYNNPAVKYTIFVQTGDYREENPVYVPPNVSIIGDNLRRVSVIPINRQFDILWCDNSVYVWGVTFREHLEPSVGAAFPILSNPLLTSVAFKNLLTPFVRYGLNYDRNKCKRDIAYILSAVQVDIVNGNNAESIRNGQAYYNGAVSVLPANQITPTIQAINYAKSLAQTVAQNGGASLSVTNIGKTFDTVVSIISGGINNYTSQTFLPSPDAITASIRLGQFTPFIQANTIAYLDELYPNVYKWRKPYVVTSPYIQGSSSITRGLNNTLQSPVTVTQVYNTTTYPSAALSIPNIDVTMDTVIGIINNGTNAFRNVTFLSADDAIIADNLLLTHTGYIQDQTINYINKLYPDLNYNQDTCRRDVGYILSAVRADILNGNNQESIYNAQAYYNGTNLVIPTNQKQPTIEALKEAQRLARYVVAGNYTNRNDVTKLMDDVTNIMTYGPSVSALYTVSPYPGALSAAELLKINTPFIQKETIAFINTVYPNLTYNIQKCERDLSYILSAVRVDVVNGNNFETTRNALAYYNGAVLTIPQDQLAPTVAAIDYAKRLAFFITTNQPMKGLGAGGGMRVDGADAEGFLRSMVLDSYTQFNEGGKGIYIRNNGYAQLVSIFTICCTEGVLCESGGTCSINTSNCSFGLSGIVATGKSPTPILSGTLLNNPFAADLVLVNAVSGIDIYPNSDYYSPIAPIDTRKIAYFPYNGLVFTIGNDPTRYTIEGNPTLSAGTDAYALTVTENIRTQYTPGEIVRFYLRSTVTTSSHTFEYIGSGIVLANAVPALGGVSIVENEAIASDGGAVYFTSTNQAGNFRVGQEFTIVQETGTIEGDTFKRSILTLVTPLQLALE